MLESYTAHAGQPVLTTYLPRTAKTAQRCPSSRLLHPQLYCAIPRRCSLRIAASLKAAATKSRSVAPPDLDDEDDEDLLEEDDVIDLIAGPPETLPEQDASLVPSKEGYHAIKLEGCEFLLATTSDGRLDLSDVYVQDDDSGIYAQPDVAGGTIPETPQLYSEIEWRQESLGDVVFDKPPMILVKMVYLIHVTQLEPRLLDLTNVWVLDAASRSIFKAVVEMQTQSQDPAEMVLRIRRDGSLIVDDAQVMPTPDELILQEEFGYQEERQEDIPDPDDDINDPIDAMEDDFDEPDVPAVDLA